ncbi:MAG: PorP/SprF family type IX secretion system membrane protein [Flavobacteriaceae bacterium]
MKLALSHIVLFLFLTQLLYAQEDGVVAFDLPVRNSLKFNRYAINPTFSFVREQNKYISFTNKREWVQFDNAPQTYLFSYSGRLSENMGVGLGLFQQNYGVLTTFGGVANFAYNVSLNTDSNLTFGTNIGFYKSGLNDGAVITNFPDSSLDNIPSNSVITVNPGINYGTAFLDFGVSINNLVSYNLTTSTLIEENPEQSIQGHVMYTGYLNSRGFFDESKFSGLFMSEFKNDQTVLSGIMMLAVPKGIWAQVGYNTLYGASAGLGLNITKQIAIEYNFEKAIGDLDAFGNSHEITLAYKFNNKDRYNYSGDDDEEAFVVTYKKSKPVVKSKVNQTRKPKVTPNETVSDVKTDEVKANEEAEEQARLDEAAEIKAAAEAKAKQLADEQANAEAQLDNEEQARLDEAARIKAEAQAKAKKLADAQAKEKAKLAEEARLARLAAKTKAKEEAEAKRIAQAKAEADKQARIAEEARLAAETKAKEEAEAKRIAQAKAEAEEQARVAEEVRLARLAAETKARIIAEAEEQARIKAEEEAKAKQIAEEEKIKEEVLDAVVVPVASDDKSKSMESLIELTDNSKIEQQDLLDKLSETIASRQKDLDNLKEENDLSEQGIVKDTPKVFKSVSAENAALQSLKVEIDDNIESQNVKITELEDLYNDRLKDVPNKEDSVNVFYLKKIQGLKTQQKQIIQSKANLLSKLENIKVATEIEKKRRIKRAAYDNQEVRYQKDRATLNQIKQNTPLSSIPLTTNDFDFGEEQSNIQIIKDVKNVESGYYLVIAVHSDVNKRDDFLTKAVSSGRTDVDFFYDVSTSQYFIYYNKFNDVDTAKNAVQAKGNRPYNSKMAIVKIEN